MELKQKGKELNHKTGTEQGPIEKGMKVKYHTRHGYSVGIFLGTPKDNFDVIVVRKTASYTEEVNKHKIIEVLDDEKFDFEAKEWRDVE